MTSYGFGFGDDRYDAYGSLGGQSFIEVVQIADTEKPLVDYDIDKNGFKLLIRDDRNNDRGVAKVSLSQNTGLSYEISPFTPGTPLVVVNFVNEKYGKDLSVKLSATDVAGNVAEYTLCYTFNQIANKYEYILQEGLTAKCGEPDPWEYGVSLGYDYLHHSADFSSTGNIISKGIFSDVMSSSVELGFIATYRIDPKVNLMGRLNFMSYAGEMVAPDSTFTSVRNPETGQLQPYKEAIRFELDGVFANIVLGLEYLFTNNFYTMGGIQFDIPLSSGVTATKEIVTPPDYVFANQSNTIGLGVESLSSLNQVGISANIGLGFRTNIYSTTQAFLETSLSQRLTNIVDDADWTVTIYNVRGGIRFPL
jgi:hypothetical protein